VSFATLRRNSQHKCPEQSKSQKRLERGAKWRTVVRGKECGPRLRAKDWIFCASCAFSRLTRNSIPQDRWAVLRIAGAVNVICGPAGFFSREKAQKAQKNLEPCHSLTEFHRFDSFRRSLIFPHGSGFDRPFPRHMLLPVPSRFCRPIPLMPKQENGLGGSLTLRSGRTVPSPPMPQWRQSRRGARMSLNSKSKPAFHLTIIFKVVAAVPAISGSGSFCRAVTAASSPVSPG